MLSTEFLPPQSFNPPSCIQFLGDPNRNVETVADFFELISSRLGRGTKWFFRGESQVYETPSLPVFARDYVQTSKNKSPIKEVDDLELVEPLGQDINGKPVLLSCLTQQELDEITRFQSSAPHDEYFEKLVGNNPDHPGWFGYAQHYGAETRLVDVSTDPLVALYFASDQSRKCDGRVWMYPAPPNIHGSQPPRTLHDAFEPAIADKQGLAFAQAGQLQTYQKRTTSDLLINSTFLFDFEAPNKRVVAQRGKFLWSGSPLHPLTQGGIGVSIPESSKKSIRNTLSAISIDETGLKLS